MQSRLITFKNDAVEFETYKHLEIAFTSKAPGMWCGSAERSRNPPHEIDF